MFTGIGCIASACGLRLSRSGGGGGGYCPKVLVVAEQNIQAQGVGQQVIPICSDLFHDLPPLAYEVIVTNSPYVDEKDMNDLPAAFHAEPMLTLATDSDSFKLVRRILAFTPDYLSENDVLICEVGNSMVHLMAQYPPVSFRWLEYAQGDNSVFVLTQQQLIACGEPFKLYRDYKPQPVRETQVRTWRVCLIYQELVRGPNGREQYWTVFLCYHIRGIPWSSPWWDH